MLGGGRVAKGSDDGHDVKFATKIGGVSFKGSLISFELSLAGCSFGDVKGHFLVFASLGFDVLGGNIVLLNDMCGEVSAGLCDLSGTHSLGVKMGFSGLGFELSENIR